MNSTPPTSEFLLSGEAEQVTAFLDFCEAHLAAISEALSPHAAPFQSSEPFEMSFTPVGQAPSAGTLLRQVVSEGSWEPYVAALRPQIKRYAREGVVLHTWSDRLLSYRHAIIALGASEDVSVANLKLILLGMEAVLSRITSLVWEVYPAELFQQFEQRSHQFAGVAECLTEALFTKTLDGTITGWNASAEALYGYTPQEVVGQNAAILVPPDRMAEYDHIMQQLQGEQSFQNLETVRVAKDGTRLDVVVNVAPVRLAGGTVVGAFTVARDVTEQRRSEEAFRVMVEAAPSGIVVTDETGIIRQVNAETERLFGYNRQELVGQSVDLMIPARFMPSHATLRQGYAADPSNRPMGLGRELAGLRKDGSEFPVEVSLQPVRVNQGTLTIAAIADITLRHEAARDLLQHQKMEAIGRLAGGVAHDFNNLLTVMMGCSELLLAELPEDNTSQRGLVSEILRATNSAEAITGQLLAFSRKSVLAPRLLDLVTLLQGLHGMLQRLLGEHIRLVVSPGPSAATVFADPAQIEQLVLNLAANAADAMPRGGTLTFNVRLVEPIPATSRPAHPWEQGDFVCFSVEDTGSGFSEEALAHIFEPFFTTKPVGQGTGLGLATVFGVVEQSNGHITVESHPGAGTRFDVYLPHAGGGETKVNHIQARRSTEQSGEGKTVLLVEDEDAVRAICQTVLQSAGYQVLVASNGQAAIDLMCVHQGRIDLLVTDVVMPEISGGELVRMSRAVRPDIRVLYMSGYTTDAVVRHGVFEAQELFLQKPFTPMTLLNRVREAIGSPSLIT